MRKEKGENQLFQDKEDNKFKWNLNFKLSIK